MCELSLSQLDKPMRHNINGIGPNPLPPEGDPDNYSELVVDAIAAALDDLIVDNVHDIAASFDVDVPHLRIDRVMLAAELPNALRFLADRLDAERAKRLQANPPREFTTHKLPEIRR
jgi:hypothetical protein